MLFYTRKVLLGFVLSLIFVPMMAFASTEFKGTETVNINKANASTLAAYLKGIGANKAEAIVKYRKANGNFKSTADLTNVPGVGDATFKEIKSKVSTSSGKSTAPEGYKLAESSGKSTSTKKKSSTKESKSSKTSSTSKTSSAEKSTSSKDKESSTSKSSSKDKKTSDSKTTSSKTKKDSTAKKSSTSKSESTKAKKTASTKKESTSKKSTSKKKSTKKKKTVKCKTGQVKVDGKCKAK